MKRLASELRGVALQVRKDAVAGRRAAQRASPLSGSRRMTVLDASAVLALVHDEPGSVVVAEALASARLGTSEMVGGVFPLAMGSTKSEGVCGREAGRRSSRAGSRVVGMFQLQHSPRRAH